MLKNHQSFAIITNRMWLLRSFPSCAILIVTNTKRACNRQTAERIMLLNKRYENTNYEYGRAMDINALCAYTSCGKDTARRLASDAGAVIRVGRRVVYDRRKIDAYMDTLTEANT